MGGLDPCRQRDSQSRRIPHQMKPAMNINPQWTPILNEINASLTRRQFFRKSATGLGVAALSSLLAPRALAAADAAPSMESVWRIAPKAKRAIYISLIGAPSQLDLFDYKPLSARFKEDLKGWLKAQGERLTGMTSGQQTFPLAPSVFKFKQCGPSGAWITELLPWHAKMADDLR